MKSFSIPISLLRQHLFCPRIPFYMEVQGIYPAQPLWVKQGVDYHDRREQLIRNRTLHHYGLAEAERHFKYKVHAPELGLHGIIDLLIEDRDAIYPVEFKQRATKPTFSTLIQLTAYAVTCESMRNKSCKGAFVIAGERAKTWPIEITNELRCKMLNINREVHRILQEGICPPSSASSGKCSQCEYLNRCNDRF